MFRRNKIENSENPIILWILAYFLVIPLGFNPKTFGTFSDLIQLNEKREKPFVGTPLSFVIPLGFNPKTFRTFSDLIRLNEKRRARLWELPFPLVIPLGFKPKTFRTGI